MSGCIFCRILAGELPAAFVRQDENLIAIMDGYPLRPGHVLVIPRRHEALMTGLNPAERGALIEAGNRIAVAMREVNPHCHDINWVVNDGKVAGQHVPHVHLHLIPRRAGDALAVGAAFARRPLSMLRKPDIAGLESQAITLRQHLSK